MAIGSTGNVGVGISATEKLEVSGNIKQSTGQFYSDPFDNSASLTFDFNNGNFQYTSASCGAVTLQNMKNGGSYTIAIQGTTSGTCTFTHSGETFLFSPANGPTISGTETTYTFFKNGKQNICYMGRRISVISLNH